MMDQVRRLLRFVRPALLLPAAAAVLPACHAQGVELTGGSSSLLGVQGITATHYVADRTSVLSIGENRQGLVLGAATELRHSDGFARLGDSAVGFTLPTDIDPSGRGVGARGVLWDQESASQHLQVFAGKAGNTFGLGYLHCLDAQHWLESFALQRTLSAKWRLTGIGAAGATRAALAAAEYSRSNRAQFAGTTGWNAGHAVAAVSASLRGDTWSARIEQSWGRLQLRPETQSPGQLNAVFIPEREGFNFNAEKRFTYWLHGDAERVSYGRDSAAGLPLGALLHEAGLTAHVRELQGGLRLLQSSDGVDHAEGFAALTAWTHRGWQLEAALLESRRTGQARSNALTATASTGVGSRARITAGADFGSSSPSLIAGAEWRDRWGSIGVNERMVYVPFGAQAGFTKVTQVSLRLHPKNVETSFDTLAGRGLRWTYTAVADRFLETSGQGDSAEPRAHRSSVELPRYVVRGQVVDEDGAPVAGAAVRVNATTIWTGGDGRWEQRGRRPETAHLQLATGDFVTTRSYVSLQPGIAAAFASEEKAQPVLLRVRVCVRCTAGRSADVPATEPSPAVSNAGREKSASGRLAVFPRLFKAVLRYARQAIW